MQSFKVAFPNLPKLPAGADQDQVQELLGGEIEARLERLLQRLGGEWKRPDWDGWAGEQNTPVQSLLVALEPGESLQDGMLILRASERARLPEVLFQAGMASSVVCLVGAIYLAHDVWKLGVLPSAVLMVVGFTGPVLLAVSLGRALMGPRNRKVMATLVQRVMELVKDPSLGLDVRPQG